ncbi:MAG: response regulator, partial [Chitinispirillaceae bacterium]
MSTKGKILVVDDEESLRILLGNELTRTGYTVEVVDNGEDALTRIHEDFYHVVLLDIILPKISGIDVLRMIKKDQIVSEVIIL